MANLAVHPEWRRHGVGSQIINKLVSKLSSHRRAKITMEIRETNLPAQLFLKSNGFIADRVLHGFYEDSGEDAFMMILSITEDWSDDESAATANRLTEPPA